MTYRDVLLITRPPNSTRCDPRCQEVSVSVAPRGLVRGPLYAAEPRGPCGTPTRFTTDAQVQAARMFVRYARASRRFPQISIPSCPADNVDRMVLPKEAGGNAGNTPPRTSKRRLGPRGRPRGASFGEYDRRVGGSGYPRHPWGLLGAATRCIRGPAARCRAREARPRRRAQSRPRPRWTPRYYPFTIRYR